MGSAALADGAPIVLFGAQASSLDANQTRNIADRIQKPPGLKFITETLSVLDELLEPLFQAYPTIDRFWVDSQLQTLRATITTGSKPELQSLGSTFLAPWTVIKQAVDYIDLGIQASPQGFCVGFLAAAAVASSANQDELQLNFSKAINLAIYIGAFVDAQSSSHPVETYSVQWPSLTLKLTLEQVLQQFHEAYISCYTDHDRVTITIRATDERQFLQATEKSGLRLSKVGLRQRFHVLQQAPNIDQLSELIRSDERLRLPHASALATPLRSNVDGELISSGNLSSIAINSILVKPSRWYELAVAATKASSTSQIIQLGGQSSLPRSLMGTVGHEDTPKASLRKTPSYDPIAIVGVACRYPEADSLHEFWNFLAAGGCAVKAVPTARFDQSSLARKQNQKFAGNFLRNPDAFDHRFFNISGREAKSMDPQQRLALQVAYEALESAGYVSNSADQERHIGCYLGVGSVDYEANVASEDANAFSAAGTLRAFISGRISHHFGWTGPSITFDTACSSSAVAIHSACRALHLGECNVALAGGVNVITAPALYQNLAAASFLNKDGSSKAFDAKANGYCRGEGAGLILLKPLTRAKADKDFIIGTIAGSGVNQGDHRTPITVPDSGSQSTLYQQVLSQAKLDPGAVTYVEAHGTGTPVGDPIEYESIRRTFAHPERSNPLFLGSVKDNIGHTEGASGVAGLIKVLMMMQHRAIPKQANFTTANPNILLDDTQALKIPTSLTPWKADQCTALINNYGAAGSNAAILLQENMQPIAMKKPGDFCVLPFRVSARSEVSVRKYAGVLLDYLQVNKPELSDLAFNLSMRFNSAHDFQIQWVSEDVEAVRTILSKMASDMTIRRHEVSKSCILCFGGQSGKGALASQELFERSPNMQRHLDRCNAALFAFGCSNITTGIFDKNVAEDIVIAHARLFVSQYVYAMTWLDNGLRPVALVGHSFGQLTALCVGGAISLRDAIKFIVTRARLIRDQWGSNCGAMLSIEGSRAAVDQLLTQSQTNAEIACINGPTSFVVAGATSDLEKIQATWEGQPTSPLTKVTRLRNSHAYHSSLVSPILKDLKAVADTITFHESAIPVETCSAVTTWPAVTAERIVEHTRQPVHFHEAIQRLVSKYADVAWIEAGASSPVIPMIRRALQSSSTSHSYHPGPQSLAALAETVTALGNEGITATFWPFNRAKIRSFHWLPLPPYQFEDHRHWIEYKPPVVSPKAASIPSALEPTAFIQPIETGPKRSKFIVNTEHELFKLCVSGHAVLGQSLCPASLYYEMALQAVQQVQGQASAINLRVIKQLEILHPLTLKPGGALFVELSTNTSGVQRFRLVTESAGLLKTSTTHAEGTVNVEEMDAVKQRFESLNILLGPSRFQAIGDSPDSESLSGKVVYKVFGSVVNYAHCYQGVRNISATGTEAEAKVLLPQPQPAILQGCLSAPIVLDNCLQVAGIHVNCLTTVQEGRVYVCTGLSGLIQFPSLAQNSARELRVYSNFRRASNSIVINDVYVMDAETNELLALVESARFTSVSLQALAQTLSKLNDAQPASNIAHPKHKRTPTDAPVFSSSPPSSAAFDIDSISSSALDISTETAITQSDVEDVDETMLALRKVIAQVLEVPLTEILPSTTLVDLGIDSLLSGEVAEEIRKTLGTDLSGQDLVSMSTVSEICAHITKTSTEAKAGNRNFEPAQGKDLTETDCSTAITRQTPSPIALAGTSDQIPKVSISAIRSFGKIRTDYDRFVAEANLTSFWQEVYPTQAILVISYLVEAFKLLGCDLATVPAGSKLPKLQYSAKHHKAVNQYFAALQEGRIIQRMDGRWVRTAQPLDETSSSQLLQDLLRQCPQHASEHLLLNTTGSELADCLSERKDPIALIFRDSQARGLLQDVYTNAPMFKAGTICLANYLFDVLETTETHRPLRILELGAGTGGTTNSVLEKLSMSKRKFQYTFTDLSPSLVSAARKRFSRYNNIEYQVVDIENQPSSELCGTYDIVFSTNCIHATSNLAASATNINALLQPNGILCLVELTQNLFWFDLVFGLLDGWWLFNDGREHALVSIDFWVRSLKQANFQWVDWTKGQSSESEILKVIVATKTSSGSSLEAVHSPGVGLPFQTKETVTYKTVDDLALEADIYYPAHVETKTQAALPVALMVHGGGHVMLSRKDIRPQQTCHLLKLGFVPLSIDYRLCPEVTLLDGPMTDTRDAWIWIKTALGSLSRKRSDVKLDTSRAVVVGWSTGGHLAMTLAWTPLACGISPPRAILAFYNPSDYEDPFWSTPNAPYASDDAAQASSLDSLDLSAGMHDRAIAAYNPPAERSALGGWMDTLDPRSRILLWMNWHGKHLQILLNGRNASPHADEPSLSSIQAISPRHWIENGTYRTPTFLIHGTEDDLIPWEQAQGTYEALQRRGVDADIRIIHGAGAHLFDTKRGWRDVHSQSSAVFDGYDFLRKHAML